ncbi:aminotransferase class I/II-fold pyridoxal phosphate-dependent enzyme [Poritiphilus flavus]|uniref:Aminotransferase class I/II-fold pyridoxal phosphate-dependent enzyme n=1 Tax=Poritiphilus flavus TaxID=2697053 RepID=A0A6L9ECY1_9FLAO|nr:8-amino-7-oxononanoate synthase [Poritiphilus flavus]NAS12604.1 aminotransferase class I/II-fold pyridoxal phosphate-dependent enzyme [Poritiphilus flavus]
MTDFPDKLNKLLEQRKAEDSLRSLETAKRLVDFSSNDYLGLARNPNLFHQSSGLLETMKIEESGATASRLLSGNHRLYQELESLLCRFYKAEAALVFNSGYDANIGLFSSVLQRNDLVFFDELIHASIRDGIMMSHAKSYKFTHNDLQDLRQKITRSLNPGSKKGAHTIYVVTESVFSMDGDSPALSELTELCQEFGCYLIVDEAHAIGVMGTGRGVLLHQSLENKVFARVVTFGKAMGCHGAAVLGSGSLKSYLTNFARSLIYSTGLPPHSLATILKAHEFIVSKEASEARKSLLENTGFFDQQIKAKDLRARVIPSDSAIRSCIIPGNKRVRQISKELADAGFDVRPILSPTVAAGTERLRFCLHSYNTQAEINGVLTILAAALQK